jgi:hypothetical protein
MKRKVMDFLQNKKIKVVRVSRTEFELDNGDIYPIPFEYDYDPTIEEFQMFLDNSRELIMELVKKNG